jgi:hypothetical protein
MTRLMIFLGLSFLAYFLFKFIVRFYFTSKTHQSRESSNTAPRATNRKVERARDTDFIEVDSRVKKEAE